ncbi:hypothetical protein KKF32_01255 [Patescibacteria group bacterium]|nr:hypothetical protein [Patescibacteria group bacterium]
MSNIIYKEKIKTPFILTSVYLIIIVFLLVLIFSPEKLNLRSLGLLMNILFLLVVFINLLLFWSFSSLKIYLTSDYLQVNFGIFKKRFLKNQFKTVIIEDFDFKEWRSYGIRLGKNNTLGYIAPAKQGLRLKVQPKDYFICTNNPQQLKELMEKNLMANNYAKD